MDESHAERLLMLAAKDALRLKRCAYSDTYKQVGWHQDNTLCNMFLEWLCRYILPILSFQMRSLLGGGQLSLIYSTMSGSAFAGWHVRSCNDQ